MHRLIIPALFVSLGFAQPADPFAPKPPAEVDQVLRARIQEFSDYHVKGQFRKAEEMVAEDTKDYFYTHDKPTYLSCEITKIDYSENFTKASAVVTCLRYIRMPGFTDKPMKVPGTNTWKIENGKWMWYVDQDALLNTPFGRMKPGEYAPNNAATAGPPNLANLSATADLLMKQTKMEPQSVRLKVGESAEVTITNAAPGPATLNINGKLLGVEATFDEKNLKAGGKATLTVRAEKGAKSGMLNVVVEQTAQALPLQVTIVE